VAFALLRAQFGSPAHMAQLLLSKFQKFRQPSRQAVQSRQPAPQYRQPSPQSRQPSPQRL
jgi:hypothetical protein